MRPKHLVLVGLSYSGKSTVGAKAAALLGLPFVDTDDEIERRTGDSVQEIFATHGEPTFRQLERQVVRDVVARPPSVIATGGGAPIDAANRQELWDGNLVVFLDCEPEALVARYAAEADGPVRPLLRGAEPLQRLRTLREHRLPVYLLAHRTIATDTRTPDEVARMLCGEYLAVGLD